MSKDSEPIKNKLKPGLSNVVAVELFLQGLSLPTDPIRREEVIQTQLKELSTPFGNDWEIVAEEHVLGCPHCLERFNHGIYLEEKGRLAPETAQLLLISTLRHVSQDPEVRERFQL